MLNGFMYNWKKGEERRRGQAYDDGRPRVEIRIPDGGLIDDRKERYNQWIDRETPKPEYGPVSVDLDIAMPSQPMNSYSLEGRL